MKVLVTGATGFIGQNLVRKLTAQGDDVRCLVRATSNTAPLEKLGVELARGDITLYESVLDAARGVDLVYHGAALVEVGVAPRSEYYLLNVEGVRNMLKACEAAGVKRLVHISTQSVAFDYTPKHYADETEPLPRKYKDLYSETKALGEAEVMKAAKESRVNAAVIRPAWVWGPGDMTILPIMAKLARRKQLMLVGGGRAEISTSFVENVCDCMILAAQHPEISAEAFLVTDDERITAGEFITQLADAAGFARPRVPLPYGLAYAFAAVAEKLHSFSGSKKPPLMTRYAIALSGRNLTYTCDKAKRMLGYKPAVDVQEGMRRLAAWVQEVGGIEALTG